MVNDHEFLESNRTPFEKGYVHVYTGNGKGKTTAAMGLALRAVGAGLRVFIAQFIKSVRYGEIEILEKLGEQVVCRQYGRGCWLHGSPSEEDALLAGEALVEVCQVISSGDFQLVILDEMNTAVFFGLLSVDDMLDLITIKPDGVELVFTGRKAAEKLIERADLVTEMREIKHYYQKGIIARKGIES
jgi:cob(I)alamin adenosyltransferase